MSRTPTIHHLHTIAAALADKDVVTAQTHLAEVAIAGERTAWDLDAIQRALQLDLTSAGQPQAPADPDGWADVRWSLLPDGSRLVTGMRRGTAQARRYLRDMRGGTFYVPVRGQYRSGVWSTGNRSKTVEG